MREARETFSPEWARASKSGAVEPLVSAGIAGVTQQILLWTSVGRLAVGRPARGLASRMYRSNTRDEHEGAGALTRASGAPHELRAVAPGAPWRPLRAARARQEAPRRVIVATSTRSGACSQWVLRRRTTPGAMQQPSVVPYSKASECGYRTRSKCAVGVIGVMEVRVTDFTAPNPLRVR